MYKPGGRVWRSKGYGFRMLRIIHPYQKVPASVQLLACGAGVFFGRANVLLAKAHVTTRKEGRKWGEYP